MLKGMYIAATGMKFQIDQLNEVAANLSNVNTSGYKRSELIGHSFDNLVTQFSHPTPNDHAGAGVMEDGRARIDSQGPLVKTSNPLNFALSGPGYFQTLGTDAQGRQVVQVTRNGDFRMDNLGFLATQTGDHVLGANNQPIQLGAAANGPVSMQPDGTLMSGRVPVGQIKVVGAQEANPVTFPASNANAPALNGGFELTQGFLESSNVNVVTEMVNMININKAFSMGQKAITTQDNELNKVVNDLGKVQ